MSNSTSTSKPTSKKESSASPPPSSPPPSPVQEETTQGQLSIDTENIFPIIKKFLYADEEVFLRELLSNAVDATKKLEKLAALGEYEEELGDLGIAIKLNPTAKTITISDKGIGMTAAEVRRYINQIAFSGATTFLEKYKQAGEDKDIIGHFGLGFYSSFMVAARVEIHTLSYQKDAKATRWSCAGDTSFELGATVKKERGTDVILHLNEEAAKKFGQKEEIKAILSKHARFLPVEITFEGEIVNDPQPLWTQAPATLNDKAYKEFYEKLYPGAPEPLFWIHLHVEYPYELKGILYFPPLAKQLNPERHRIQLYARQVFITEDLQGIVPVYLQLLHGVLDAPDIPLNVSRSALQSDQRVKQIQSHISKKVADVLQERFKEDRKGFEETWKDIGVFVKYGSCNDDKFAERTRSLLLLENVEGKFYSWEAYCQKVAEKQRTKKNDTVFLYTTDKKLQHGLIESATARGYDVLSMDGPVDTPFIGHMESKESSVRWRRVDSDSLDRLIDKGTTRTSLLDKEKEEALITHFKTLGKEATGYAVLARAEALRPEEPPLQVLTPEYVRRMHEMAALNGTAVAGMPEGYELLLNSAHPTMKALASLDDKVQHDALAKDMFDLARLAVNRLGGSERTQFVSRAFSDIQSCLGANPTPKK